MPITERTAPTASAAESRKRGTVRPAGARQREQIERKSSDALDAIARDSQNTVALDDALAAAIELNDEPRIADLLGRKAHASPDDPELRFAYAAALMRLRQWVLALPELRTVITERPEHVRAWHNLALALHALGSLSDARDAWGRVIALSPSDLDSRARRAEILLDLGDWRNAAADLEFIIAADASATDAALNLALARLKLREFDAARAAIRPLLDIEPLKMTAHRRMQEIDLAQREVSTAP
ncbi:MAG: tetratricopeptide repeat protein [Phycisphaerae bacterium]